MRYKEFSFCLLISCMSLLSCKSRPNTKATAPSGPSTATQGAQTSEANAGLNITNSIRETDQPKPERLKAVVQIFAYEGGGKAEFCTGTWVSPRTLITASHCTEKGRIYYLSKYGSSKQVSMPDWLGQARTQSIDVTVVQFSVDLAPAWIPISTRPVAIGDKVTIGGYGFSTALGGSPWGYGTTSVELFEGANMFDIYGSNQERIEGEEGTYSATNPGDSGGPALREGQLIGSLIGSGGTSRPNSTRDAYVNLTSPSIKAYLDAMVAAGADIRFTDNYPEGTNPWEECFDVKAQDAKPFTIKFEVPHTKVSKVTGEWSNCNCEDCPMVDGRGYLTGPLASIRPEYTDVPDAALLVWGAHFRRDDAPFAKAGFWQGEPLSLADMSFQAQLKMHYVGDYSKNIGTLNVCFL